MDTKETERLTRYHSDRWTLVDQLGMHHTGMHLARMILEADLPFAVRVTGKWGAGKTSVLRHAFTVLGGKPIAQAVPIGPERQEATSPSMKNFEHLKLDVFKAKEHDSKWEKAQIAAVNEARRLSMPVWYSPWQHQAEGNPLVPLLHEICAQYRGWMNFKEGGMATARKIGMAALNGLEKTMDIAATLTFGKNINVFSGTADAVRRGWEEGQYPHEQMSDGQRFHLLFEDAVENALEGLWHLRDGRKDYFDKARLVIFIDDLDRCNEETVVSMLECIKLYLDTKRCVFVFGIDDNAVARALRHHWGGRSDHDNREYLEKLFQATVNVPHPGTSKIVDLVKDQLEAHDFPRPEEHAVHIERLLEPNPRKIKNFTNSLCANWYLVRDHHLRCEVPSQVPAGEAEDEYRHNYPTRFLMFSYLRIFHRQVWRILEHQPQTLALLHKVLVPNSDGGPVGEDKDIETMAKNLFTRMFFHVLAPHNWDFDNDNQRQLSHGDLPIKEAVDEFLDRLDQKRSDAYLAEMMRDYIIGGTAIDEAFLRLPTQDKAETE